MEGEAKIAYRQGAVLKSLRHGNFLPWIKVEFGMSHATAWNFINVAQAFGDKSLRVRNLSPKALYLLAAPSMPEGVRHYPGMMAARKAAKPRTQPPTNQPPASEIFHLAAFSSDSVPAFLALEIR